MILLLHHSPTVRAHAMAVCAPLGEVVISCTTVSAARDLLRSNDIDAILLDEWVEDGSGRSLIAEIRSEDETKSIAVVWLASRKAAESVFAATDAALLPDSFVAKSEMTERLPEELRRLVPGIRQEVVNNEGAKDRAAASTAPSLNTETNRGAKPRVLVIDDSLTYRMQMRAGLTSAGYDVVLADSGERGLEVAFAEPLAAAIIDNMLPGIQGAAVVRRLRTESTTRRLPCLLLTASEDPGNEIAALDAGADSFVRKDEVMDVILVRLTAILRGSLSPPAIEFTPVLSLDRRIVLAGDGFEDASTLLARLVKSGFVVERERSLEDMAETPRELPVDVIVIAARQDDALEFCRKMKSAEATRGTRLMLMECLSSDRVAESGRAAAQAAAIQAGADDYLPMSLPFEVMKARMETQLRRKRMEDENRALGEHLLRQQLEAEQQRDLAEERAIHAEEIGAAKEIVEQKAAEAERLRLELEQVLESIPQMVLLATREGELLSYNRQWLRYTGESARRDVFSLWRDVLAPEDFERHTADRVRGLSTGLGYAGEYRIRRSDGEYRWFWVQAIPMMDESSRLGADGALMSPAGMSENARWLATCTDIHDRKVAEEVMLRTEKLAATGRLAASIAHEINNPLEAVTNLLYLTRQGVAAGSDEESYVTLAQQEISRVSEIAKKTLAFYRESRGPSSVDMAALVHETAEVYASRLRSRHLELRVDVRTELRPRGLAGELRQIISNLISNAIDAAQLESEICVRLKASVDWTKVNPQRGIRLLVFDRGAGIAKSMRTEIFKPFVTSKGLNGTGLGLWVSSSIAERHRGVLRFWTSDREGRSGTCFSLFLPLDAEQSDSAPDSMGAMLKEIGSELLQR